MKIIKGGTYTPGRRHYKFIQKYLLCKQNNLLKHLVFNVTKGVGRSKSTGHITIGNKGGGCKKLYRQLKFFNKPTLGVLLFTFYDPNRSSFVSLFFDFLTFKFSYVLTQKSLYAGSILGCTINKMFYKVGFRSRLKNHPNGAICSAVASGFFKTPQYALAAGTFCQLLQRDDEFCKVRLPSNQVITVSAYCFSTLGVVSNIYHNLTRMGKAGRNRLKGFRPHVRGIAKNPVDHPHGGRTPGGCDWVTPWGKPFRFRSTSRSKFKKIVLVE